MNKEEIYQEHTKLKIAIISEYVGEYTVIMLNAIKQNEAINIFDLFAGQGKDSKGNFGIAVKSVKKIIKIVKEEAYALNKKVNIYLNDKNKDKLDKLKHIINQEIPEIQELIENGNLSIFYTAIDAQIYIEENLEQETRGARHNLIILDPYGYTQVSDMKSLMNKEKRDYVLFVPLTHISRFKKSKEGISPQWAINFCTSIGDTENKILDSINEEYMAEGIREALKNSAKKEYSLNEILTSENKLGRGKYQVLCITDHQKGADTFLRCIEKAKNNLENSKVGQIRLDLKVKGLTEEEERKEKIIKEIIEQENYKIDNVKLYYALLNRGIVVSSSFMKSLKEKGTIEMINEENGKKAPHSCVNYNQCKTKNAKPKVIIKLIEQNLF